MTCATFILEIFESLGFAVVDVMAWPEGDSDEEWTEQIIQGLRRQAEHSHTDALEREKGGIRIRPDEIVAATLKAPPPVSFDDCAEAANEIRSLCS